MACRSNPSDLREPALRAGAVTEGVFFFGDFLSDKQKKVTGGHGWPTNDTWT